MIRRILSAFSRRWAGSVYAAVVPVTPGVPEGAATFVEDLWRVAPVRVALLTTLGALAVSLSPVVVIGRPTLFHRLSPADRERVLERMMRARPYVFRLLFYGVKSMALVAVLRDPECRRQLGLDGAPRP